MFFTFIPTTALVIVSHDLVDYQLGEYLIMRDAVEHFAESFHKVHEGNSTLCRSQEMNQAKHWGTRTLKIGLGENFAH